jgi:hypothetical protein
MMKEIETKQKNYFIYQIIYLLLFPQNPILFCIHSSILLPRVCFRIVPLITTAIVQKIIENQHLSLLLFVLIVYSILIFDMLLPFFFLPALRFLFFSNILFSCGVTGFFFLFFSANFFYTKFFFVYMNFTSLLFI